MFGLIIDFLEQVSEKTPTVKGRNNVLPNKYSLALFGLLVCYAVDCQVRMASTPHASAPWHYYVLLAMSGLVAGLFKQLEENMQPAKGRNNVLPNKCSLLMFGLLVLYAADTQVRHGNTPTGLGALSDATDVHEDGAMLLATPALGNEVLEDGTSEWDTTLLSDVAAIN